MDQREKGNPRFGKFLRDLREERRLTLGQVEELSIPYRTRISQTYLSRCENGIARPSADRLAILAKIYRSNTGVLLDRLETEEELATLGPIDVTSTSFEDLSHKGRQYAERGELKAAFAYFRAAEDRAALESAPEAATQIAKARLSMAITLTQMARYQLAKDEAERAYALMEEKSEDCFRPLLVLAVCHLRLGNTRMATVFLDLLAQKMDRLPLHDQADTLLFKGNVDVEMRNYRKSVLAFRQAASLYSKRRDLIGQSRSRKNAAVAYGKLGEYPRAIEQATKALDLARKADDKQQVARCLATLGEMHCRLRSHQAARKLLLESIEVARKGDYHDTLFSSYFYLWRLDSEAGDRSAPSIERVLRSLLPKLDEVLEEAEEFRRLTGLKGENEHE